jgi:hypothetical protein
MQMMNKPFAFSLGDYLQAIAAPLPPALVPPSDLVAATTLLAKFPAQLADTLFFEIRLGRSDAPTDVSFSVRPAAARVLHAIATDYLSHPVWAGLHRFAQQWDSETTPRIAALWLEFDMPTADAIPILFIDPQPSIGNGAAYVQWANTFFPRLTGQALSPALVHHMANAIDVRTAGQPVHMFGSLMARGTSAQRLSVLVQDCDEILPYLRRTGWDISADALQPMLSLAARQGFLGALNLDITDDGVLPKVGIEYFMRDSEQVVRFLPSLVALGLCEPDRAAALSGFGAVSRAFSDPRHPAPLRTASQLLDGRAESHIVWEVCHIKVTCDVYAVDCPLEAKAYVRARREWRTPSGQHWPRTALDRKSSSR